MIVRWGFWEVVAAGGPYFAGFILRNFVLSMFLAALALAIGPTSLGDVDLWMAKVSALSANEHESTTAAHCISLRSSNSTTTTSPTGV